MKMTAGNKKDEMETAVFGGGCFWCLEAVFAKLRGVRSVVSGYAGGTVKEPTYEEVGSGKTGHAEVAQVEFDPKLIAFSDLLSVFFAMYDPTTLNRQGADVGTQYRSIILYENEAQKIAAEEFVNKLAAENVFADPIVTEIKPLEKFYSAEEYHQKYFENNPLKPYCQFNISPKVAKLREKFHKLTQKK